MKESASRVHPHETEGAIFNVFGRSPSSPNPYLRAAQPDFLAFPLLSSMSGRESRLVNREGTIRPPTLFPRRLEGCREGGTPGEGQARLTAVFTVFPPRPSSPNLIYDPLMPDPGSGWTIGDDCAGGPAIKRLFQFASKAAASRLIATI